MKADYGLTLKEIADHEPKLGETVRLLPRFRINHGHVARDQTYVRITDVDAEQCTGIVVECPTSWPEVLRGPARASPLKVGDTVAFDARAIWGTMEDTQRSVERRNAEKRNAAEAEGERGS